jgi:hypothetical protein
MPISQHSNLLTYFKLINIWKLKGKNMFNSMHRPNYIDNIVHDWLDVFYYTFPDAKKNPEMCR